MKLGIRRELGLYADSIANYGVLSRGYTAVRHRGLLEQFWRAQLKDQAKV